MYEDYTQITRRHSFIYSSPTAECQNLQQSLELSSNMFNVYWVINEVVFPWNVSIMLIKKPYSTGIAISWCLDFFISNHAVGTIGSSAIWRTGPLASPYPTPSPRSKSVGLVFPQRTGCLPLNSRVTNSALWVPPPQKWVLMTRYVEARKINTDCSCRH
jgi:hypothetical protein